MNISKWTKRWKENGASDQEMEDILVDFFSTVHEVEPTDELRSEVKEIMKLENRFLSIVFLVRQIDLFFTFLGLY